MKKYLKKNISYVFMILGITLLSLSIMFAEWFSWQVPIACGMIIGSLVIESATDN